MGKGFIPDQLGRFDVRLPDYVWSDRALVKLGKLLRCYHDAAASFPWNERNWRLQPQEPFGRSVTMISHPGIPSSGLGSLSRSSIGMLQHQDRAPGTSASLRGVGCPSGVTTNAKRMVC
ncbi:hypothetical protein FHT70_002558 [Rhizobium sp. BK049]|nr:hypothetical protein [Rhizobium sp. BK049]